ncbi:hypothetical protein LINPERPRIM_LOCUS38972, partial [Linum perenne]
QIRRLRVRFTSGSIPITTIYFLWQICNSDVTQVSFLVALIHVLFEMLLRCYSYSRITQKIHE